MKNKKLIIFTHSLGRGGAEKVVSTLLFSLADELDITLVLLEDIIIYPVPVQVRIEVLSGNFLRQIFSYVKICKKVSPDVVLAVLFRPNILALISKVLGLVRSRLCISEHIALSHWRSNEFLNYALRKKVVGLFYPHADKIIVVSEFIRKDLIRNYALPEPIIEVIYNPHNLDEIQSLKNSFLEFDYLRDKDKTIFATMGTLCGRKGHHLAIRALSKLQNNNTVLWILGSGDDFDDLRLLAEELGVKQRVHFFGFQRNPYAILGRVDIFLLPSLNEGLPNALIEAMACGCAVISSDCASGPREILAPMSDPTELLPKESDLEYAEYGILFPTWNESRLLEAMTVLMSNKNTLQRYQSKSVERALFFNKEHSIKTYRSILVGSLK